MNVFFVCGAPKSGTTWLQRILDAHPQVCCSGEGHFIERFALPMAEVIGRYNAHLQTVAEQVYEGRPFYGPVSRAEFDALVRTFAANRMGSRAHGGEVRWLGDKTPSYTRHLRDLARIFPQAQFIHIVRDPRDVAVSRMGHNHRAGIEGALTAGSKHNRMILEDAIAAWRRGVDDVDHFAAHHPGRLHEVRYCSLQDDPRTEVARLFAFLGAPATGELIDEIVAATSFEALSGRKAGQEDLSSFFRKGVSGDWVNVLDAEAVATVEEACGEAMRRRGFLPLADAGREAAA